MATPWLDGLHLTCKGQGRLSSLATTATIVPILERDSCLTVSTTVAVASDSACIVAPPPPPPCLHSHHLPYKVLGQLPSLYLHETTTMDSVGNIIEVGATIAYDSRGIMRINKSYLHQCHSQCLHCSHSYDPIDRNYLVTSFTGGFHLRDLSFLCKTITW